VVIEKKMNMNNVIYEQKIEKKVVLVQKCVQHMMLQNQIAVMVSSTLEKLVLLALLIYEKNVLVIVETEN
jgi:hypothetical protein